MSKKSLLSLLLAMSLAMFMYACGGGDDNNTGTDGDTDTVEESEGTPVFCKGTSDDPAALDVGSPCTQDSQCYTKFCLDQAKLTSLGVDDLTIEGGFCTALLISEEKDCMCQVSEGKGMWVSLLAWFGMDDQGICLVPCDTDADCTASGTGFKCFDPDSIFNYSLYPACMATLYQGRKGCMPEGIIQAAIDDMPDPAEISCE